MSADKMARSWWHTIPGIITAIAALITAVGGLLGVLLAAGVIGGPDAPEARVAETTQNSSPNESAATSAGPQRTGPAKPWPQADAVFHRSDGGDDVVVRAQSVGHCINSQNWMVLTSGQQIPFEKMRSVKVLRSDDKYMTGGQADVEITTADGKQVRGSTDSGCGFIGLSDLGRFEIYAEQLDLLEFKR